MDRMRALEVFVEVVEAGGLAAAARNLSLSAPSVTRILNDLEADLGVVLIRRSTRIMTLTEVGTSFLGDAKRIISEYAEARDAVRGAHRVPKGTLRITAPTLFGQHYITDIILEYLSTYLDVVVECVYLDRVVNLIDEGFDIAVRIGRLPDSNLYAARVGQVRRVVCGMPCYFRDHKLPKTPLDLRAHEIVAARPVGPTDDWRFRDGVTVRIRPRLTFSSMPAAIGAVKTGFGLTRVLSYQIGPELREGTLQTILTDYEPDPLPIHIVHADGQATSAKVRSFVNLATKRLRKNPLINEKY
ncbi:MAG: LysR family transcriptional regulator [Hyphomicrobiaceae bacterium]